MYSLQCSYLQSNCSQQIGVREATLDHASNTVIGGLLYIACFLRHFLLFKCIFWPALGFINYEYWNFTLLRWRVLRSCCFFPRCFCLSRKFLLYLSFIIVFNVVSNSFLLLLHMLFLYFYFIIYSLLGKLRISRCVEFICLVVSTSKIVLPSRYCFLPLITFKLCQYLFWDRSAWNQMKGS